MEVPRLGIIRTKDGEVAINRRSPEERAQVIEGIMDSKKFVSYMKRYDSPLLGGVLREGLEAILDVDNTDDRRITMLHNTNPRLIDDVLCRRLRYRPSPLGEVTLDEPSRETRIYFWRGKGFLYIVGPESKTQIDKSDISKGI